MTATSAMRVSPAAIIAAMAPGLGAGALGIGDVLDIAATMTVARRSTANGRADLEAGIGRIGAFADFGGGLQQHGTSGLTSWTGVCAREVHSGSAHRVTVSGHRIGRSVALGGGTLGSPDQASVVVDRPGNDDFQKLEVLGRLCSGWPCPAGSRRHRRGTGGRAPCPRPASVISPAMTKVNRMSPSCMVQEPACPRRAARP